MTLSENDVLHILRLVEESSFDSLQLEYGDLKLAVSKSGDFPAQFAQAPAEVAADETFAINRSRDVESKWVGHRLDYPALASIARARGLQAEGPILGEQSFRTNLKKVIAAVDNGQLALSMLSSRRTT